MAQNDANLIGFFKALARSPFFWLGLLFALLALTT